MAWTRFFIASRALLATFRFTSRPLATQKLYPRNVRFHGRSTALFASLIRSRSYPYRRRSNCMASSPARFDLT
jgi:hypothetical protein